MIICTNCGKKVPPSRKLCPHCRHPARVVSERKIPVITAIIAIVFLGIIIFGVTAVVIARIRDRTEPGTDVGLHLNGTWVTQSPTFNDEHIIYVFYDDSFSSIIERTLFGASPETLDNFIEIYTTYHGATIDAEYIGGSSYFIRISTSGTFILDGYRILLVKGEGLLVPYPFYWDGEAIYINDIRFVRQD